jgi:hypothetical protein
VQILYRHVTIFISIEILKGFRQLSMQIIFIDFLQSLLKSIAESDLLWIGENFRELYVWWGVSAASVHPIIKLFGRLHIQSMANILQFSVATLIIF